MTGLYVRHDQKMHFRLLQVICGEGSFA
ncbi:uncharacterized protein METZ01_LOCUS505789, partial [marine metagenome]